MKKLNNIISFGFISLLPIQDFALSKLGIGFLGANVSFLFIPLMALMLLYNKVKFKYSYLISFVFFVIFSCVVFLICYFYNYNVDLSSGFKLLILLLFLVVVLLFYYEFKIEYFELSLFFCFFVFLIGFISFDLLKINFINIFHATTLYDGRFRGFSIESSFFTATFIFITLSLLVLKESKGETVSKIYLLLIVFFVALTGSKGAILSIIFALIITALFSFKISFKRMFYCIALIPILYYLLNLAMSSLYIDIENYNSFGTRTGLLLAALKLSLHFPFGTGLWGYYIIPKDYIIDIANNSNFNVMELYSIASNYNYSFKSGFADSLVLFGAIPVLYVYMKCFAFYLKIRNVFYLSLLVVSSLFLLTSSITYIGYYFSLLPLIVIFQMSKEG